MFRHHGLSRSERENTRLAAYLACVGGYVNSAGFLSLGVFTSHVTGNVARLADQLASRQLMAAGAVFGLVCAFYAGALLASLIVESRTFSRSAVAYGVALSFEAILLALFAGLESGRSRAPAGLHEADALLLCMSMGVQNSLVTRLSGAVVRTTHLTGVVTDLGIETAQWLSGWRSAHTSHTTQRARASGRPSREPAIIGKLKLHLTIVLTFTLGAVLGCMLTPRLQPLSMLVPSIVVAAGACYAFASARTAPLRASGAPRS
jgi:uncharacterized membrane protein YoaK (UPF0700 family)